MEHKTYKSTKPPQAKYTLTKDRHLKPVDAGIEGFLPVRVMELTILSDGGAEGTVEHRTQIETRSYTEYRTQTWSFVVDAAHVDDVVKRALSGELFWINIE